jgi:hypothetical protein
MQKQDPSVQAILIRMGLPHESQSKEEIMQFMLHASIMDMLRGIDPCNIDHMRVMLTKLRGAPLLQLVYSIGNDGYRGNLLHHVVRQPSFLYTNTLEFIVAILQSLGCDFYHQCDSNGDAACLLAARLIKEKTFFHTIAQLRQPCIQLLVDRSYADTVEEIQAACQRSSMNLPCRLAYCDKWLTPETNIDSVDIRLCIIVTNNEVTEHIVNYSHFCQKVIVIQFSSHPADTTTTKNISLIFLRDQSELSQRLIECLT